MALLSFNNFSLSSGGHAKLHNFIIHIFFLVLICPKKLF